MTCRACAVAVSGALLELVGGPAPLFDAAGERYRPGMAGATIERGTAWRCDGSLEWGSPGDVVVHADDLRGVAPIGAWIGCCGPTGMDGLNLACPNGHAIGTRVADCWSPDFAVLAAHAVALIAASDEPGFPGDVVTLDPGRPLREPGALWVRLHELLGCSAWYGDDLASLLEDRVTASDDPALLIWRASAASRAAGLPVDAVLDGFVAARRRHGARVMLILA